MVPQGPYAVLGIELELTMHQESMSQETMCQEQSKLSYIISLVPKINLLKTKCSFRIKCSCKMPKLNR